MGNVILDMALSLDGYIAGPNNADAGLHDWYFSPTDKSRQVIDEFLHTFGAIVMGKRAYELGAQAAGFVDNPYKMPHFVLTHAGMTMTLTN